MFKIFYRIMYQARLRIDENRVCDLSSGDIRTFTSNDDTEEFLEILTDDVCYHRLYM